MLEAYRQNAKIADWSNGVSHSLAETVVRSSVCGAISLNKAGETTEEDIYLARDECVKDNTKYTKYRGKRLLGITSQMLTKYKLLRNKKVMKILNNLWRKNSRILAIPLLASPNLLRAKLRKIMIVFGQMMNWNVTNQINAIANVASATETKCV